MVSKMFKVLLNVTGQFLMHRHANLKLLFQIFFLASIPVTFLNVRTETFTDKDN